MLALPSSRVAPELTAKLPLLAPPPTRRKLLARLCTWPLLLTLTLVKDVPPVVAAALLMMGCEPTPVHWKFWISAWLSKTEPARLFQTAPLETLTKAPLPV